MSTEGEQELSERIRQMSPDRLLSRINSLEKLYRELQDSGKYPMIWRFRDRNLADILDGLERNVEGIQKEQALHDKWEAKNQHVRQQVLDGDVIARLFALEEFAAGVAGWVHGKNSLPSVPIWKKLHADPRQAVSGLAFATTCKDHGLRFCSSCFR